MPEWTPNLAPGPTPVYARILERLTSDIDAGALAPGARLPTQRALANQLGVGLGTVTRVYAEAEARGLIDAVVGRGSFVAARPREPLPTGVIDLARNLPPSAPVAAALRRAVAALARRPDLVERLDYAPSEGMPADRSAGAEWLRRTQTLPGADADRLVVTAGAQQAIAVALAATCRPGDALIIEEATFHGARLAAAHLGLRLAPAPMDAEGVTPDALERAAAETGARVAYLLPFQNPTARVMSLARRQDVLAVARRRAITIIEDDLYGVHVADLALPALAELAPDRVIYISGLSKSLAPGLRTGYLAPPDAFRPRVLEALRAAAFGSPTFGALIAAHWIETGEAFALLETIVVELERRTRLATSLLGGHVESMPRRESPHLWLPLTELEAERVASQALRAGVEVTPPEAPFARGVPVSGLRLCLGAAPDIGTLERGLKVVLAALQPRRSLSEAVV
jgi:DNA-binding transcriptional MocR family regulator